MELLHTLFYFVIAIGVLVAFHEFGHFYIARKVGVKVLRFSIGFGKILWSYQKNPEATEYALSAVPLGGYVKMVDEREGEVKPEDLPYAFNRQALWARTAIVSAGPMANLLLAVVFFWAVLVIGESGMKPIIGEMPQDSLAASAGFEPGDQIISVNNKLTPTWSVALSEIITAALDSQQAIKVVVKDVADTQSTRTLQIPETDAENPNTLYQRLGFTPWSPKLKPIIGKIMPDSAALTAGLKQGDLIVSADGVSIADWAQWVEIVKVHPNKPIKLQIERDSAPLSLTITPKAVQLEGKTEGKIGAAVYVSDELIKSLSAEYSLPPLEAIPAAFKTTWNYSVTTLKMLGKMLIGKASVENLSGPISIAQYAGQSADMGLVHFLKFLGLISVSLGVLNFLPIPVLDGGYLLFFGLEAIRGKPLSEKAQLFYQQLGIALLLMLMTLTTFLDVQRLFN